MLREPGEAPLLRRSAFRIGADPKNGRGATFCGFRRAFGPPAHLRTSRASSATCALITPPRFLSTVDHSPPHCAPLHCSFRPKGTLVTHDSYVPQLSSWSLTTQGRKTLERHIGFSSDLLFSPVAPFIIYTDNSLALHSIQHHL